MSKQELNDCLKSFYTSARKQDGSYYKTPSMKSILAAIDQRFSLLERKSAACEWYPCAAQPSSTVQCCSLKVASLFSTTNFNTYSPVQTAQRSSHVVDRSSHDRSTISATATSKFTTTTASPAEQLIADIVTLLSAQSYKIF